MQPKHFEFSLSRFPQSPFIDFPSKVIAFLNFIMLNPFAKCCHFKFDSGFGSHFPIYIFMVTNGCVNSQNMQNYKKKCL